MKIFDKENLDVRLSLKAASEGWDAALDQLNAATLRADAAERKLGEASALIRVVSDWLGENQFTGSDAQDLHKRLGALLSASAEPANPESTDLYRFLDAAAGEGLICGDVDAEDLFISLYPDAYDRLAAEPAKGGDGEVQS